MVYPPPQLCTDNGVMVAWAGIEKINRNISNMIIEQEPIPRWPIGTPLEGKDLFSKKYNNTKVNNSNNIVIKI